MKKHCLSDQPAPMLHHSLSDMFCPYIYADFPFLQPECVSLCEESGSVLKHPLFSLNSGGLQKDTSLSFSIQSKVTLLCQPPLMHHMLFPHNHPVGLLLGSFQYISVSLVPGIPTLDTILQKQCCKN